MKKASIGEKRIKREKGLRRKWIKRKIQKRDSKQKVYWRKIWVKKYFHQLRIEKISDGLITSRLKKEIDFKWSSVSSRDRYEDWRTARPIGVSSNHGLEEG